MKPDPSLRPPQVAEARLESPPEESKEATPSHRPSVAPGFFLTAVLAGVLAMGLAIYWLLRGMRI